MNSIGNAAKWNIAAEIIAKLIAPITTIVLARILAPEIFGIVASITAITSLADLLTDAGFNAYIVQHQFDSIEDQNRTVNVCFWSNFAISVVLYFVIFFFRYDFSKLVEASGYETALAIAALVIPLTSMSSISMAVMQKKLAFKKLGIIKIICKVIPFLTTIPLALLGFGCWSLIIGTLVGEVASFLLCFIFGDYRPRFQYKFKIFREIFSFTSWAYLESILEWLLKNGVILFLGAIYGAYYLGLFKNGTTIILQIITAVYALYGNVYKSAIAKYQNDDKKFKEIFLTFQRYTTLISIPLAVGVFLYRDFVTFVLLGEEYAEVSLLIGLWGLTGSLSIAFGNFYSDGIRAKGKPVILVIIDAIYLLGIGLLLIFAKSITFQQFCIIYSLLKIVQPLLQMFIGYFICKVSLWAVLKNTYIQIISAIIMAVPVIVFRLYDRSVLISILSIVLCVFIFFGSVILLVPRKKEMFEMIKSTLRRRKLVVEGEGDTNVEMPLDDSNNQIDEQSEVLDENDNEIDEEGEEQ